MRDVGIMGRGEPDKIRLNKRIEDIGWGLLLILTGGILLIPDSQVPQGSWLIGAGIILLGLNVVRHFNGIRANWFSSLMGIIALIAGAGEFSGLDLPLFPIFLIVIGASLVLRPFFKGVS